ncbi:hypothetical protein LX32DRAFT_153425 [Colletotrichum zoysiae]|uniref:Uncharacterized protein n=1 Tax=Colletotrichum zoysiae TaxID=1216348 RepID=A0AAD9HVU1_9PEZI|nr:hypothetical protein LX32DRAFT_153425 [Colletotrichum zoysiae]
MRDQDATPGPALAGRLLRALGLPIHQRGHHHHHHHHYYHHHDGASASEPDAIALELAPWPSPPVATEPTTPTSTTITTTTDGNTTTCELDSCECDFPQTIRRRCCSPSSWGNLQGHTRANSLDSTTTTTSSSATSLTSSPSPTSSSRREKYDQDESAAADRKAKYIEARRRKESTELWRQYW